MFKGKPQLALGLCYAHCLLAQAGTCFLPKQRGSENWGTPIPNLICLRKLFFFPCWFYREPITTGNTCICFPGLKQMEANGTNSLSSTWSSQQAPPPPVLKRKRSCGIPFLTFAGCLNPLGKKFTLLLRGKQSINS